MCSRGGRGQRQQHGKRWREGPGPPAVPSSSQGLAGRTSPGCLWMSGSRAAGLMPPDQWGPQGGPLGSPEMGQHKMAGVRHWRGQHECLGCTVQGRCSPALQRRRSLQRPALRAHSLRGGLGGSIPGRFQGPSTGSPGNFFSPAYPGDPAAALAPALLRPEAERCRGGAADAGEDEGPPSDGAATGSPQEDRVVPKASREGEWSCWRPEGAWALARGQRRRLQRAASWRPLDQERKLPPPIAQDSAGVSKGQGTSRQGHVRPRGKPPGRASLHPPPPGPSAGGPGAEARCATSHGLACQAPAWTAHPAAHHSQQRQSPQPRDVPTMGPTWS